MALTDEITNYLSNIMPILKVRDNINLAQSDIALLLDFTEVEYVSPKKTLVFKYKEKAFCEHLMNRFSKTKTDMLVEQLQLFSIDIEHVDFVLLYVGKDIFQQVMNAEEQARRFSYYKTIDRSMTFGSYIKDENNKDVYNICSAAAYGEATFVVIIGETGTGKTHLASAVINSVLDGEYKEKKNIAFFKKDKFFFFLTEAAKNKNVEAFKNALMTIDVLCFDDFQQFLDIDNQFYYKILFDIIDYRISTFRNDYHATIITSHDMPDTYKYPLEDKHKIYDEDFLKYYTVENENGLLRKVPRSALTSRLVEFARPIRLPNTEVKIRFLQQVLAQENIDILKWDRDATELFRMIVSQFSGAYRELKQLASSFVTYFQNDNFQSSPVEIIEKVLYTYNDSLLRINHGLDKNKIFIERRLSVLLHKLRFYKDQLMDLKKGCPDEFFQARGVIAYYLSENEGFSTGKIGDVFKISKSRVSQIISVVRAAIEAGDAAYLDKLKLLQTSPDRN